MQLAKLHWHLKLLMISTFPQDAFPPISSHRHSLSTMMSLKKIHKIFKNGQYLEDFDLFLPFFVVKYVIT